ncbi:hypothetical protein AAHC03_01512 [Spirometra sp. Aus1]
MNSVLAINTYAAQEANSTNPHDKDKQSSFLAAAEIEDNSARAQCLMKPIFGVHYTIRAINELDAELSSIFAALSTCLLQELRGLLNGTPECVIVEHASVIMAGYRLPDLLPKDKAKMGFVQWFVSNHLIEY